MRIPRGFHAAASGVIWSFFVAGQHRAGLMHRIVLTHSSGCGHLGCFPVLAVVTRAAKSTGVDAPFQINVFIFFCLNAQKRDCRVVWYLSFFSFGGSSGLFPAGAAPLLPPPPSSGDLWSFW